jgi:hypothetical protein
MREDELHGAGDAGVLELEVALEAQVVGQIELGDR